VKKSVYFDVFDRRGWPAPEELQHYFLAPRAALDLWAWSQRLLGSNR
jgi:hypothetical protein